MATASAKPRTARWLARCGARAAFVALVLLVSSAIYAPFLANDRPYVMVAIDSAAYDTSLDELEPLAREWHSRLIGAAAAEQGVRHSDLASVHHAFEARQELGRELRALELRLATLRRFAPVEREWQDPLDEFEHRLRGWTNKIAERDLDDLGPAETLVAGSAALRERYRADADGPKLRERRSFPLLAALDTVDWFVALAWTIALALAVARASWKRHLGALVAALVVAWLANAGFRDPPGLSTPAPKAALASGDVVASTVVFAPIPFGRDETNLSEPLRPPTWWSGAELDGEGRYVRGPRARASDPSTGLAPVNESVRILPGEPALNSPLRHPCGTDALGRDVLARTLWGGRPSRGRRLDRRRAPRAGGGAARARARLRARGACARPVASARAAAARAAERARARAGRRGFRGGFRDPRRVERVVPRLRDPRAEPELGRADAGGAHRPARVAVPVPRRLPARHGAVPELARRRGAGCARSARGAPVSARAVLETRGLRVRHHSRGGAGVEALRGVELALEPGRLLALVGESGAGKSTLGRALLGLLPRESTVEGEVRVGERLLAHGDERAWAAVRGRTVAWLPQDPLAALDPTWTVLEQVAEAPRLADGLAPQAALELARAALERAGLGDAALWERYPHQLSGGQRQRALLACALVRSPAALVADEPTSALDASLALHVIQSLRELAARDGLAVLWITHDLPAALCHADEIAVLLAGELVERGTPQALRAGAAHEYTRALLAAGGVR
ncbi:MAG: ATP-binding cassette domain-containing protein [Planctomycetota bacterium]|nr:ATP-binding cassette domain-containing protein [Planctomycetota bacterium]